LQSVPGSLILKCVAEATLPMVEIARQEDGKAAIHQAIRPPRHHATKMTRQEQNKPPNKQEDDTGRQEDSKAPSKQSSKRTSPLGTKTTRQQAS
jgi:hypothetical protein